MRAILFKEERFGDVWRYMMVVTDEGREITRFGLEYDKKPDESVLSKDALKVIKGLAKDHKKKKVFSVSLDE